MNQRSFTMNEIYLNKVEGAPLPGTSKLFGNPDVAEDFEWPSIIDEDDIYDLTFMGQLNLRELTALVPEHPLPKSGMLYFFYDLDAMAFSPFDETAAKVIFTDSNAGLEELCLQDEDGNDLSDPPIKLGLGTSAANGSCYKLFGLPKGFTSAKYPRPIEDWTMLLQLESSEAVEFEDGGTLCFFIHPDKLEKADFSDVRVMIVSNK